VDELGELLKSFAAYLAIAPSTAPGDGGRPYYLFEVDRPVAPMRGGCFRRYPEQLRNAHITGSVFTEFVVGADGRAEPATFRATRATHPQFAEAVRQAMSCMRYTPALADGRPVRQLVEQPFTFDIAVDR
jgi:TonB family protein